MRKHVIFIALTALVSGIIGSVALLQLTTGTIRTEDAESQGPAHRVVSLAPNITESICAIGGTDALVGVTSFCTWPPEVRRIPRVGGPVNPSRERLLSLSPDLVVAQMPNPALAEFCARHGIRFEALQMTTIDRITDGIIRLGRLLGRPGAARRLTADIRLGLQGIRTRCRGLRRPAALLTIGRRPGSMSGVFTAGPDTFIGQLLDIAGARNAFDDLGDAYREVSKEAILRRGPEVIIETMPDLAFSPQIGEQIVRDWQALGDLPAVEKGRVWVVTDQALQIPGPRVVRAAALLAACCHPEVFPVPGKGIIRLRTYRGNAE